MLLAASGEYLAIPRWRGLRSLIIWGLFLVHGKFWSGLILQKILAQILFTDLKDIAENAKNFFVNFYFGPRHIFPLTKWILDQVFAFKPKHNLDVKNPIAQEGFTESFFDMLCFERPKFNRERRISERSIENHNLQNRCNKLRHYFLKKHILRCCYFDHVL